MSYFSDICILIDDSILTVHHGVRRYLMTLYSNLEAQGHTVYLIKGAVSEGREVLVGESNLLLDNGFAGNTLMGASRGEILTHVRSGRAELLKHGSMKSNIRSNPVDTRLPCFDLCIVAAPWVIQPNFDPPKAKRYVCVAYDAIPNLYYFDNPRDHGLHLFANAHYQGYRWADEKANGIYCISTLTALQCKAFGFGSCNGLSIIPPMIPPGYLTLSDARIDTPRGRVAVLAAPFDRRKGLLSIPRLINAGNFDSLRIFGRPRCSSDDLIEFFEKLEIEDVQWWLDVDFEKQVDLYTSAKVLIFPSLNEGLGFPVIEAYACGTSVLTSDIDPLNQLVLKEDCLTSDDMMREAQVLSRADESMSPLKYRRFVESLCSDRNLGLIAECEP